METQNKTKKIVKYRTDEDGHSLSVTPCPYWRMNHHGISDAPKYVGTMECGGCRWFCDKDVKAKTITCSIPNKLIERYEREHRRMMLYKEEVMEAIKKALELQALKDASGTSATLDASVQRANEMKRASRKVMYTRQQWSRNNDGHAHYHEGCIYVERYNKGRGYYAQRWVAEIMILGCRYRMRSYNYERCWAWIQNIREIYRFVRNRFAWQKDKREISLMAIQHLASVGILPLRINTFRSVISRHNAKEAYKRAMAVYDATHKRQHISS